MQVQPGRRAKRGNEEIPFFKDYGRKASGGYFSRGSKGHEVDPELGELKFAQAHFRRAQGSIHNVWCSVCDVVHDTM